MGEMKVSQSGDMGDYSTGAKERIKTGKNG
jgi:hypothetical protein